VIPRNSNSATSMTTASDLLADPALLVERADALRNRETETLDAALARVVAALDRYRPTWHTDPTRGCADMPVAVFVSKQAADRAEAFSACGRCPADIRKACARWAVEVGDTVAIAGGMDPAARRPLIREHRRLLAERETANEQENCTDVTP